MPKFSYTAYSRGNEAMPISDTIEAASRVEVTRLLMSRGFQPISIEEVAESGINWNINITPDKIKPQDLAFFSRQLATLVGAGIPVISALEISGRAAKKAPFRIAVEEVRQDIIQGTQLSGALAKHPNFFDSLYVSLVRAGENGDLQAALVRLADMLETSAQQRREVRGAMVYPAVVLTVATVILVAMLTFVVPAFQGIFKQAGGDLPGLTKMLVNASNTLRSNFLLIAGAFIGAALGFRYWKRTEDGRFKWDAFKMKLPLGIGSLVSKIVTARYARTLATLQSSGVPLLQSMEISAPTAGNKVVERAVRQAADDVQNGRPLSAALRQAEVFPDMAMSMLESGERAGRVGEMLNKVAETYEQEVSNAIKAMKSILEPVMIVGIGAMIAVVVVALYLPMFSIYQTVNKGGG